MNEQSEPQNTEATPAAEAPETASPAAEAPETAELEGDEDGDEDGDEKSADDE